MADLSTTCECGHQDTDHTDDGDTCFAGSMFAGDCNCDGFMPLGSPPGTVCVSCGQVGHAACVAVLPAAEAFGRLFGG